MRNELLKIGANAQNAFKQKIDTRTKNKVLLEFSRLLKKDKLKVMSANKKDVFNASKKGLKNNMIKRLELDDKKLDEIILSIKEIIQLNDPVDIVLSKWRPANGLNIKRVTIPIGVIGVIYESRPNVTSDVSCLSFKSGNCVILKGGSESFYSNLVISNLFRKALSKYKVNKDYVQFIKKKIEML